MSTGPITNLKFGEIGKHRQSQPREASLKQKPFEPKLDKTLRMILKNLLEAEDRPTRDVKLLDALV